MGVNGVSLWLLRDSLRTCVLISLRFLSYLLLTFDRHGVDRLLSFPYFLLRFDRLLLRSLQGQLLVGILVLKTSRFWQVYVDLSLVGLLVMSILV